MYVPWMTPRTSGSESSEHGAGFSGLGLDQRVVDALAALGYEEPTPVQREAIPPLLAGRDVLGQAATGTGKTAAFALPLLHILTPDADPRERTRAFILVPTRELAMQVAEAIHRYGRGTDLHVVPLYGGASMQQQMRALSRGADIVIATPGGQIAVRADRLKLRAANLAPGRLSATVRTIEYQGTHHQITLAAPAINDLTAILNDAEFDAVAPRLGEPMIVDCLDCDAELVANDQHDDHLSPAGARYQCPDCGALWVWGANGLSNEIDVTQ